MIQVKESNDEISIESQMNLWLKEHVDIKIVDIKYSANENSSNALVIYEEGVQGGK